MMRPRGFLARNSSFAHASKNCFKNSFFASFKEFEVIFSRGCISCSHTNCVKRKIIFLSVQNWGGKKVIKITRGPKWEKVWWLFFGRKSTMTSIERPTDNSNYEVSLPRGQNKQFVMENEFFFPNETSSPSFSSSKIESLMKSGDYPNLSSFPLMLKNCLFRIVHGKLFSLAYPFLPLHFRHFLSLYSSESSFSRALHVNFWIRRFTLEQKLSDDVFAQEEETSFEEQTALCVKLQFCSPREWQESAEWNQNNGYGLKLGRTQPDSFRACESFAWIWGPIRNSAPFRFRG